MMSSNATSVVLFLLSVLIHGSYNLDYSDLEAMGVTCPLQDKCDGYGNNLNYTERSCECDRACRTYGDCCIDVRRRPSDSSVVPNRMTCLNVGESLHTGVYAITNCSNSWRGSAEGRFRVPHSFSKLSGKRSSGGWKASIRQKCEGPDDFSDPLLAAPVTSTAQAVTYRNSYCAECNNAVMNSLKLFHIKLSCDNLAELPEAQIIADITYSRRHRSWGVNRLNYAGDATVFHACQIIFDAPPYLNRSLRFCRSNVISTCDPLWTRYTVRRACEEYMAVVYDNEYAYRNPHCAICNGKTVDDISCLTDLYSRKRPMSFALLLDVNQSDGDQVGMTRVPTPECPSNHIYDPFFKRCKRLACAIPGHVLVDGRCVRA